MIRPRIEAPQVTIAEDQSEYKPVTAALVTNDLYAVASGGRHNTVVIAFSPDDAERARLAAGEAIYVSLLTFGGPMQPIIVTVGAEDTAAMYGVPVESP